LSLVILSNNNGRGRRKEDLEHRAHTGLCHTEKVTLTDTLFGARLYVLAFAICLVAL
jgi:hypothetical protein